MSPDALLDQDFGLVADLIHGYAQERPQHPALIHEARVLTYGELDSLMDRVAASLQRDGIHTGAVIAICAASCVEYGAIFLGALRAGVAVAPLAPSSTAQALATMLADCGAKILFLDDAISAELAGQELPAGLRQQPLSMRGWLAPEGAKPKPVQIDPAAPFNIIYSSGTTGTPKGIVQSHRMRWAHVHRAALARYDRTAVTICSTPLYSNTTLVSFFPTLARGGTVVLMAKFDALRFLELAQRHGATHAMLVPVQYQRIMDLPQFDRFDLGRFRMKFCTSAPFAAALKADVLKRWPGGLTEYYGMTEGGGTCILEAHAHPDKLHTVGRPADKHDIRVIDETGRELPRGQTGEVVGHSQAMMTAYHGKPEMTAAAEWHCPDGKRFIRTGDIGRFDVDGFVTLLDRRKDMIISGGFNVYPSDIEARLREHAAVAEVAVVGMPSARWGETPVAFVVRRAGADIAANTLRDWLNASVGKTQRLAELLYVTELPRNALGKVLKRELRDMLRR